MVIAVYNPVGEVARSESAQAAKLAELRGRPVGFVCNHHPAITELWAQLEEAIERHFLPAAVHRVAKPNISLPQPAAQLAALASNVDYALVGVGA